MTLFIQLISITESVPIFLTHVTLTVDYVLKEQNNTIKIFDFFFFPEWTILLETLVHSRSQLGYFSEGVFGGMEHRASYYALYSFCLAIEKSGASTSLVRNVRVCSHILQLIDKHCRVRLALWK